MGERRAWERGMEPPRWGAASHQPWQNCFPPQNTLPAAGAGTSDALPGRSPGQSPESGSHTKMPEGGCGCPRVFADARTHSCARAPGGLRAGEVTGFAPGHSVGWVGAGADASSAETCGPGFTPRLNVSSPGFPGMVWERRQALVFLLPQICPLPPSQGCRQSRRNPGFASGPNFCAFSI